MQKLVIVSLLLVAGVPRTLNATATAGSIQRVQISGIPTVLNGAVIPPQIVTHPNPIYTDEARQRRIEGNVVVQALFDSDGNFKVLRVLKSLGFGLDESALTALQNWRFLPAVRNGERVSVVADIEVPFKLLEDEYRRLVEQHAREAVQRVQQLLEMRKLHQQLEHSTPNGQRDEEIRELLKKLRDSEPR